MLFIYIMYYVLLGMLRIFTLRELVIWMLGLNWFRDNLFVLLLFLDVFGGIVVSKLDVLLL